jgi:hypothetical protein
MAKRLYREGNTEFHMVSLRALVRRSQFRVGFRDYLHGRPFPNFTDDWDYERGRLLCCWLIATRQRLPAVSNVDQMARLYRAAEDAGALL